METLNKIVIVEKQCVKCENNKSIDKIIEKTNKILKYIIL